jgi:hypothetical protein
MDEGIHMTGLFFRDVIRDGKTPDLASYLAGRGRGVKFGNQVDARLSSQQTGPVFGNRVPNRADTAQTCHYNAATIHSQILKLHLKRLQKSPGRGF